MMDLNFLTGLVRVSLLGLMGVVSAGDAAATLGQGRSTLPAASVASSASSARMSAAASTARPSSNLYTSHESALENGTAVWEYATPAGLVFALAWRGPVLPDLNTLLGSYFKAFKVEAAQTRALGGRGSPINMERDGLVLRSGGRMRNFFGYAYVPALVPAGVDIKDVLQ